MVHGPFELAPNFTVYKENFDAPKFQLSEAWATAFVAAVQLLPHRIMRWFNGYSVLELPLVFGDLSTDSASEKHLRSSRQDGAEWGQFVLPGVASPRGINLLELAR